MKKLGENLPKDKIAEIIVNESRIRWEVINKYKQKFYMDKIPKEDGQLKQVSSLIFYGIDDITTVNCYFNAD